MILFTSPEKVKQDGKVTVFLAGSIEMGVAVEWQTKLINELKDLDCIILNPRRKEWDATWEQSIDNPNFNEQVTWELDGIDMSDLVVFYFDPATKSPVTMLELGLMAKEGNAIIYCPEGFFRKGNIDITASRNKIPVFTNEQQFFDEVKKTIKYFNEQLP